MSGIHFGARISSGEKKNRLLLQLHVVKLEMESEKTYPSYFRTITQLSLHTLHTVVTGSLQGGGRLRAFVEKKHTLMLRTLSIFDSGKSWSGR